MPPASRRFIPCHSFRRAWLMRLCVRNIQCLCLIPQAPSPQALGSPTGYVVLRDPCLLRPDGPLSQAGPRTSGSSLYRGPFMARQLPQFTLHSLANMPYPLSRRLGRLLMAVASSSVPAFTLRERVRPNHAVFPAKVGSREEENFETADFTLCYGLLACSPLTDKGLLLPSFRLFCHLHRRRI